MHWIVLFSALGGWFLGTLGMLAVVRWANRRAARAATAGAKHTRPIRAGWKLWLVALLGPFVIPFYYGLTRRRLLPMAFGLLLTFALCAVYAVAALGLSYPIGVARLWGVQREVRALSTDIESLSWTRPVLRGESVPGNAGQALAGALQGLDGLPNLRFDDEAQWEPGELEDLFLIYEEQLAVLRAATQHPTVSRRHDVDQDLARSGKADSGSVANTAALLRRAGLVLLGAALQDEPGECMAKTADVVRLSQDAAAGGHLAELLVGAGLTKRAVVRATGCVKDAALEDRQKAAREFRALAVSGAPFGQAFATGAALFFAKLSAADAAAQTPALPLSEPFHAKRWGALANQAWERITGYDALEGLGRFVTDDLEELLYDESPWFRSCSRIDAAAALASEARRWAALDTSDLPTALRRGRAMLRARYRRESLNSALAETRPSRPLEYLDVYGVSQAYLRIAVVALEARAEEARDGYFPGAPPQALGWPELADPFTGKPLRWERRGELLHLCSAGPDGSHAGPEAVVQRAPDVDDRCLTLAIAE